MAVIESATGRKAWRWASAGAALLALSAPARADLSCRPVSLAEKEPIVMRLCVDALGEEMIVVFNEHRGLDATPVIAGCALTFADGKKKIVRWKQGLIGPREESRQRGPLRGLPSPIDAACEIERVKLSSEFADDNDGAPLRPDAGSLVGWTGSTKALGQPQAAPAPQRPAVPYTIQINPNALLDRQSELPSGRGRPESKKSAAGKARGKKEAAHETEGQG